MTFRGGCVLALVALAGAAGAQEVRPPEGGAVTHSEIVTGTRYSLPIGPATADGTVPARVLEGTVQHTVWQIAPPRTVPVLLASVREQIMQAGYDLLLDCEARRCGGFDFRVAVEDLGAPVMVVDLGRYGYLGALHPETGVYLAALASETGDISYVQITRIAPADLEEPELALVGSDSASPALRDVTPSEGSASADFADQLLANGAAVLEDLQFATGSAELAQEEFPSLRALALYLRENPARAFMLVGHSDARGSAEANLALSMRRAEAVRNRLIAAHDVDGARLRAEGVGFLAPRASNATQDGRRANRRVEAVLLSP